MPEYSVYLSGVIPIQATVKVEAESREEAEQIARDMENIVWQKDAEEIDLVIIEEESS